MKNEILTQLLSQKDLKYQKFESSLIPNINPSCIIGVRMPFIRKMAKDIFSKNLHDEHLRSLPHTYHEENVLHACLVSMTKSFDECIDSLDAFLPFVDNWAVCDSIRPKCFKDNHDKLLPHLRKWISSSHTYTSRFGIEMLMLHFLGDDFSIKHHDLVAESNSDDYYHEMMRAWYFATALSKQYEKTLPYLQKDILGEWVFKKTIQKATESRVISKEQKQYLKSLRTN